VLRIEPTGDAPAVPEDADRGPGSGTLDEHATRWLDMSAFVAEVDSALSRQRDGFSNIVPARGVGVKVSVEMLLRLQRSFGLAARAQHARLPATHACAACSA
jgi:hypothetical protein